MMTNSYLQPLFRIAARTLTTLLLTVGVAHAQDTLRIGYWNIPPHVTGVVNDKPTGTAISYFETYIEPHLSVSVIWERNLTPPTRLMDQLRKGDIDAMIFLGKTPERTEYLYYPDPYLDIPQTLAFRKEHAPARVSRINDLYGLTIGFLLGGRLPQTLRDDRIQFDLIAGERLLQRNLDKLMRDRIDAIYAPLTIALANTIEAMELSEEVRLVPIEFLDPVLIYTVFSRKTVDEPVVESYNKALRAARKEQNYNDYVELHKTRGVLN